MPHHRRFISPPSLNPSNRDYLTFSSVSRARLLISGSALCPACEKLCLQTEAEARAYIGLLLHTRRRLKHRSYALHPYHCRAGNGWHVGRNPSVIAMDFSHGRVGPGRCRGGGHQ